MRHLSHLFYLIFVIPALIYVGVARPNDEVLYKYMLYLGLFLTAYNVYMLLKYGGIDAVLGSCVAGPALIYGGWKSNKLNKREGTVIAIAGGLLTIYHGFTVTKETYENKSGGNNDSADYDYNDGEDLDFE